MEVSSTASGAPIVAPQRVRLRFRDRSEVSLAIKYLIFTFNILIWVIGVLMIAAGSWALTQKDNNISVLRNLFMSPVLLLLITGCIIFLVGFFGCIGALRENICLLVIYMILVGIIFLCVVAISVILFVFKEWLKKEVMDSGLVNDAISKYRDDADFQNFIDWVQADWLHCCGGESYSDWDLNIYFNCSSPGVESCGVPFSCCQPSTENELDIKASNVIYTEGCIEKGEDWFHQYMIPVAGVLVGVAVALLMGLCCAWNLVSDIRRQKARWKLQQ